MGVNIHAFSFFSRIKLPALASDIDSIAREIQKRKGRSCSAYSRFPWDIRIAFTRLLMYGDIVNKKQSSDPRGEAAPGRRKSPHSEVPSVPDRPSRASGYRKPQLPGSTMGGVPIAQIQRLREKDPEGFPAQRRSEFRNESRPYQGERPKRPFVRDRDDTVSDQGHYMRPTPRPQEFQRPKDTEEAPRREHTSRANASWGSVANWYKEHLEGDDTFHVKVLLPNLLRLIDPKHSEQIIDVACGEGFFARALRERGAAITGVDIAAPLIEAAKRHEVPGITYHVGSAIELSEIAPGPFDQALCVLALQNMEHADHAIIEVAKVLKGGGSFHLVLNHPAFRIPKETYWGYDDAKHVQFRRVDRYLSEAKEEITMHPGAKVSEKTISYHHPLQWYVKHLAKSGLMIDRLEEWISHKVSDSGPRANAENRARKEIPLFLYIRAKKM